MACNSCNSTAPLTTFDVQYFYSNQCFDCGDGSCVHTTNSKCVIYTGPNLSCSGVVTNDSIETALAKIDTQICSAIGDYSTYQFNCLTAWWGPAITQESDFVDAITGYACEVTGIVDTFINTTYVANQLSITNQFAAINNPGITCAIAGVGAGDTLTQVLNKYCTTFTTINNKLDVSGITWDNCLVVGVPPTTLLEGIQLLADQICAISGVGVLPTINNLANGGTCLATPGAADSIVSTIGKINTYLCGLDVYDASSTTWGCVPVQTDIQGAIDELVLQASNRLKEVIIFSGDFVVSQTNGLDPCDGITVDLAVPLAQDRFVAVSALDAAPGTLITKVASAGGTVAVTNSGDVTLNLEVADGDRGDVTISASGATYTIDNDVVTYAKMQNMSTARMLGRTSGGAGDVEEISVGTGLSLSAGVLSSTVASVASGTYSPGTLNGTNLDSLSSSAAQYMQVGDVVTVSGRITADPTTTLTPTSFELTLPIATVFTPGQYWLAGGTAVSDSITLECIAIKANASGTTVIFTWVPTTTASSDYYYSFTYLVIAP